MTFELVSEEGKKRKIVEKGGIVLVVYDNVVNDVRKKKQKL